MTDILSNYCKNSYVVSSKLIAGFIEKKSEVIFIDIILVTSAADLWLSTAFS